MKRARWRAIGPLLVGSVLLAAPAVAEYRHRVVVLTAASDQAASTELFARLRGELTAAGLDVVMAPAPEAMDVRDAVESSARELAPSAVIGVRYVAGVTPDQTTVEVWISDRLSARTLVQRAQLWTPTTSQAARLAVQVSELFKARLALLWVEPPPEAPPRPIPPPALPPPPAEESPPVVPLASRPRHGAPRLLFGAGVGVVRQLTDPLAAWFPSFQLGVEPGSLPWATFALRASAGWTPTDAELQGGASRARVSQIWGLAQGLVRFAPEALVQPTVSLGGGVYSVGVEGEAEAPDTPRSERTWAAAATVGIGVWLEPTKGLAFALEGQGLTTSSKTVVRIHQQDSATFGLSAAVLSASVIGKY